MLPPVFCLEVKMKDIINPSEMAAINHGLYRYYPFVFYCNTEKYIWYIPEPNRWDTRRNNSICHPIITVIGTHIYRELNQQVATMLERFGWYTFVSTSEVQKRDDLHDPEGRYDLICPHMNTSSFYNNTKHKIEMSHAIYVVSVKGFTGSLTEDFIKHARHCGRKIFYSDDYTVNIEEV